MIISSADHYDLSVVCQPLQAGAGEVRTHLPHPPPYGPETRNSHSGTCYVHVGINMMRIKLSAELVKSCNYI